MSLIYRNQIFFKESDFHYRGSPTYAVFTNADPTTAVFGGFFVLVGDPYKPTTDKETDESWYIFIICKNQFWFVGWAGL